MTGTLVPILIAGIALAAAQPTLVPSVIGLVPNVSSLEEVRNRLGETPTVEDVSSGERVLRLCYVAERERDPTSLVFESGFEGGWSVMSEYALRTGLPKQIHSDACAKNKSVNRGLSISNRLRLGLSRNQAARLVGSTPILRSESRLLYQWRRESPPTPEQQAALQQAHNGVPPPPGTLIINVRLIDLRFDAGKLVEIRVRETEVL